MISRLGLILCLPCIDGLAAVPAAGPPPEPAAWVAELREDRNLRRTGAPVSAYAGIDASIATAAAKRVAGFDPAVLPVAQARDWAALYLLAEQYSAAQTLLGRYLAATPADGGLFGLQLEYLLASARAQDGEALYETLRTVSIPAAQAAVLGSHFGGSFHHYVLNARGPAACLEIIARIETKIPDGPYVNDEVRKNHGWARRQLAATKALYLAESGRREEAIAVLDRALETLDDDIFRKEGLRGDRHRYRLFDLPAPALPFEGSHGDFDGLAALRGRVVLLEFTAHWCHACHKAIPALRELRAALRDRKFDIVAVTTYYGFFGAEHQLKRDMPRDAEFARMPALLAKQEANWPMIYVERSAFQDYGVTGIPQFMVLDREGVIRAIDIGFSGEKFARLKHKVLELLAE